MKRFSVHERRENIETLAREEFDVLIIGGGIVGAGAARDAASRGMKVGLIEAKDFASGTSSRSSKLIHGGLRYLENLEFHLVFEALSERTKLFQIAPHLVHPLRFMVPVYEDSRVGMFKMGLGMWLYDALALFQAPEMHERLSSAESMQRMPSLQSQKLTGSYVYSDAYMDDARLVHETLRSAHEWNAVAANFVKASGVEYGDNGIINAVTAEDSLSGKKIKIRARHVISSVGPWTDELGAQIFTDWKSILRPTKGVHLTFQKSRLQLSSAVVMGEGNRIVFGIPRHEMVIVGTTDTDYKGSPEGVVATTEDVKYLLNIIDLYFPGAKITEKDIVASYAGVRPLVQDASASEGKTSREHVILEDPRGVTFVAGGKYTTYRLMAEQVMQHALKSFAYEDRARFARNQTTIPLNKFASPESFAEALGSVAKWTHETGRPQAEIQLLAERYGLEAAEILHHYPQNYTHWQLEAAQAIDHTMCLDLVNFYARRVPLFLSEPQHGLQFLNEISAVFREKLFWSETELQKQQADLEKYMRRELAWEGSL